jgi:predicted nucleic acid-binding protein
MSKTFIDSNVVLYLFSSDKVKANRAESLLRSGGLISVQVLNEVTSVCLRKLKMSWADMDLVLLALKNNCEVLPLTLASHEKAVDLAKRFQISFYDANIAATAILSGADTLLTEDMQNGMTMDCLTVINPFRSRSEISKDSQAKGSSSA